MNAGFGSWLLGMALGAGAPGGMLGMAGGIFIALAATTIVTALLYAISGFGFAVLAAPLFLLFLGPVNEPWGVRRFYVRDPFGRLLNILTHG